MSDTQWPDISSSLSTVLYYSLSTALYYSLSTALYYSLPKATSTDTIMSSRLDPSGLQTNKLYWYYCFRCGDDSHGVTPYKDCAFRCTVVDASQCSIVLNKPVYKRSLQHLFRLVQFSSINSNIVDYSIVVLNIMELCWPLQYSTIQYGTVQ